ncbi:MAG: hypothetical protein CMJ76_12845 [Planctomycetaceae bacterium]|nr:hypothetical protein [Planctomycetaceae bacterium]
MFEQSSLLRITRNDSINSHIDISLLPENWVGWSDSTSQAIKLKIYLKIVKTIIMMVKHTMLLPALAVVIIYLLPSATRAEVPGETNDEAAFTAKRAAHGYRLLVDTPLLQSDFSQEVFDNVWQIWPKPLREKARLSTPAERRQMAFSRYGLTPRADNPEKPLQYVVDSSGNWTMNCFACHGGTVYGKPVAGAPNNRFALQTLTEEIRQTKIKLAKPLSRMDLGSLVIPLGTTNGTTNAVVFGMGLMSQRDKDLNIVFSPPRRFIHHDMDAPAWWNFHKRPNLYIDGFAQKGHRGLMQFLMIPENDRSFFLEHEDDFRDVYTYISSLRPPKYHGAINDFLAAKGRQVFENNCARCHGSYGENPVYPNLRIELKDIGTDPVRLNALEIEGRSKYSRSWFAHANEQGEQKTVINPNGYVAPALDGIWASAPYLHNGSVPTLWHLLKPQTRPVVWKPVAHEFNEKLVGLSVKEVPQIPASESDPAIRRSYFDTRKLGKKNTGHDYPATLSDSQRHALLEYLKTL